MRVIEVSDCEGAAAYAGKLFQRWGAEVVKVESPSRPAPRRAADMYLNGGKRRLRVDLGDAADRQHVSQLCQAADVLLTDLGVCELESLSVLELGGDARIIRTSITPFGLDGPYSRNEATAATLLALGGYTWLMGDPGRAPLTMPGNYVYFQAGTYAYAASLAGVMSGNTGPTRLEISMHECLASLHQFTDTMWKFGNIVRSRHGNRWENLCPTTLLRAADGWWGCNIIPTFWFQFAHMIGRHELAAEGVLSTNDGRMGAQDEVEAMITEALFDTPVKQIFRDGQEAWRVPVGYAASLGDVLQDPHLEHREFWRAGVSAGRPVRLPGSPFRIVGEDRPPEPEVLEPEANPGAAAWQLPGAFTPAGPGKASRPLEGVRVLDLTRIWSGPLATRILGDLGAEVIKVEARDGRGAAFPGLTGASPWNRQGLFNKLNRNKQSVCIDLKSAEGRRIFLDLVAKSDVVIENFSARAMPSLGLGYDALRKANGQVIYLAMPAFGMDGPYRDYVGLGPSIEPITGLTALMGYGPDEPRVTSKALTDAIAGTTAASAVITALWRRKSTGAGCLIDLSQHEAGVAFLGEEFVESQLAGREPERRGNRHRDFSPHGVYRCLGDDDWIALAARSEDEWHALCRVLGIADLAQDQRFSDPASRQANSPDLDAAIERATGRWKKHELQARLADAGVPAGAVLTAPEYLADRHLADRGYFVELEHPEAGTTAWDGSPIRFNAERGYGDWLAAPCLGQDNRRVLTNLLHISTDALEALCASGVLADAPSGYAQP